MEEPKVPISGLGIPESPRWHEGRLWFCNWIDRQIVAVSIDGTPAVFPARDQGQLMGYSIDWLPDGRLLMTGDKLRRQEPDGSMITLAEQKANEIVVDGRGNIYLNGADFNFSGGEAPEPGDIKLITPDGQLRQVAGDIQFPNGMVITPDNQTLIISESFTGRLTAFDIGPDGGLSGRRVFAAGVAPDGICLDAEGAVWVSTGFSFVRVAESGEVLQRVELPEGRAPFALTRIFIHWCFGVKSSASAAVSLAEPLKLYDLGSWPTGWYPAREAGPWGCAGRDRACGPL